MHHCPFITGGIFFLIHLFSLSNFPSEHQKIKTAIPLKTNPTLSHCRTEILMLILTSTIHANCPPTDIGHGIEGILIPVKWHDSLKASCWSKRWQKLVTRSYSHSNRLMATRSTYVYMLLPICAQFVMQTGIPVCKYFSNPRMYAYRDPRMHTAIPVCIILHMGIQDLISHIWKQFHYAYKDPHMQTYQPYANIPESTLKII